MIAREVGAQLVPYVVCQGQLHNEPAEQVATPCWPGEDTEGWSTELGTSGALASGSASLHNIPLAPPETLLLLLTSCSLGRHSTLLCSLILVTLWLFDIPRREAPNHM